jgi:hypothetical protein
MHTVTRMRHTGWRVQAKRDWANSPNEWPILRPFANGIIWKHSLEKKVRPSSKFGVSNAGAEPFSMVSAKAAYRRFQSTLWRSG